MFQDEPSQYLLYEAGRVGQRPRPLASLSRDLQIGYMEVWGATRVLLSAFHGGGFSKIQESALPASLKR